MHKHSHNISDHDFSKAFLIGIVLNAAFVAVEIIIGLQTNSLTLLSDAWHNFSDVMSLSLALFAIRLARKKANDTYTYGYHKGTILASLANATILLIAVGSIGWEAIQRFMHPEVTAGKTISIVAAIGIVVNTISALLFFRQKDKDLNVKSAYLHLAVDALVSLGVVIAGILIYYTGYQWLDPLVSIGIMLVVIYSTWGVMTESLRLSMDAVPAALDVETIKTEILKEKGVLNVYHIHIWAMSTSRNAMTAHLVVDKNLNEEQLTDIKKKLRHTLEHLQIQHVTLELETG